MFHTSYLNLPPKVLALEAAARCPSPGDIPFPKFITIPADVAEKVRKLNPFDARQEINSHMYKHLRRLVAKRHRASRQLVDETMHFPKILRREIEVQRLSDALNKEAPLPAVEDRRPVCDLWDCDQSTNEECGHQ